MTAQSGDVAGDRSRPWVLDHPGAGALICSVVAIAGIVLVVGWLLAQHSGDPRPDLLGSLWDVVPLLVGAPMFLLGLPTAVALAGASCTTGRELWCGVAGGAVSVVLTLVLVVVVLPVDGLAL